MRIVRIAAFSLLIFAAAMATAQTAAHSVSLTWTQSADPVTADKVYRSQTQGGPYASIFTSTAPITSYTDTNVTAGQTYYYVVTALNGSGESGYSNEAKAVIPLAPPTALTPTVK